MEWCHKQNGYVTRMHCRPTSDRQYKNECEKKLKCRRFLMINGQKIQQKRLFLSFISISHFPIRKWRHISMSVRFSRKCLPCVNLSRFYNYYFIIIIIFFLFVQYINLVFMKACIHIAHIAEQKSTFVFCNSLSPWY